MHHKGRNPCGNGVVYMRRRASTAAARLTLVLTACCRSGQRAQALLITSPTLARPSTLRGSGSSSSADGVGSRTSLFQAARGRPLSVSGHVSDDCNSNMDRLVRNGVRNMSPPYRISRQSSSSLAMQQNRGGWDDYFNDGSSNGNSNANNNNNNNNNNNSRRRGGEQEEGRGSGRSAGRGAGRGGNSASGSRAWAGDSRSNRGRAGRGDEGWVGESRGYNDRRSSGGDHRQGGGGDGFWEDSGGSYGGRRYNDGRGGGGRNFGSRGRGGNSRDFQRNDNYGSGGRNRASNYGARGGRSSSRGGGSGGGRYGDANQNWGGGGGGGGDDKGFLARGGDGYNGYDNGHQRRYGGGRGGTRGSGGRSRGSGRRRAVDNDEERTYNTDEVEVVEWGTGDDGRWDDYNDFSDTGGTFEKPVGADTVYGEDFARLQGLEEFSSGGRAGESRGESFKTRQRLSAEEEVRNAMQQRSRRPSQFREELENDDTPDEPNPNVRIGGASNSIDWGYNKVKNFQAARSHNRERRGAPTGGRAPGHRGGGEIAGTGRGGPRKRMPSKVERKEDSLSPSAFIDDSQNGDRSSGFESTPVENPSVVAAPTPKGSESMSNRDITTLEVMESPAGNAARSARTAGSDGSDGRPFVVGKSYNDRQSSTEDEADKRGMMGKAPVSDISQSSSSSTIESSLGGIGLPSGKRSEPVEADSFFGDYFSTQPSPSDRFQEQSQEQSQTHVREQKPSSDSFRAEVSLRPSPSEIEGEQKELYEEQSSERSTERFPERSAEQRAPRKAAAEWDESERRYGTQQRRSEPIEKVDIQLKSPARGDGFDSYDKLRAAQDMGAPPQAERFGEQRGRGSRDSVRFDDDNQWGRAEGPDREWGADGAGEMESRAWLRNDDRASDQDGSGARKKGSLPSWKVPKAETPQAMANAQPVPEWLPKHGGLGDDDRDRVLPLPEGIDTSIKKLGVAGLEKMLKDKLLNMKGAHLKDDDDIDFYDEDDEGFEENITVGDESSGGTEGKSDDPSATGAPIGSGIVARAEAAAEGGGFRMRSPRPSSVIENKPPVAGSPLEQALQEGGDGEGISPGGDIDVTSPVEGVAEAEEGGKKKKKQKKKAQDGVVDGSGNVLRSPLEIAGSAALVNPKKEAEERRKAKEEEAAGRNAENGKNAKGQEKVEMEVSFDSIININTMPTLKQQGAVSFRDLGIDNDQVLENIGALGIKSPTEVQIAGIRGLMSEDKDVIVHAYTGSGKTLAYLLPVISSIDPDNGSLQAIVVAPGRELASQIATVCDALTQGLAIRSCMVIGGANALRQVEKVKKGRPHIIIATPGRLCELAFDRQKIRLGNVRTVVLDEVDALLRAPYDQEIDAIIDATPSGRRQMAFASATGRSPAVTAAAERYMREDPVFVGGGGGEGGKGGRGYAGLPSNIRHTILTVAKVKKFDALRRLLNTQPFPESVMIFVNDPMQVNWLTEKLELSGIIAAPLSGESSKDDRAEIMKRLQDKRVTMVVTTEMAARGLDVSHLTHVVNYDLPTDGEHYVHRAGRCGRAGRPGIVINIATPETKFVVGKFANQLGTTFEDAEVQGGRFWSVTRTDPNAPPATTSTAKSNTVDQTVGIGSPAERSVETSVVDELEDFFAEPLGNKPVGAWDDDDGVDRSFLGDSDNFEVFDEIDADEDTGDSTNAGFSLTASMLGSDLANLSSRKRPIPGQTGTEKATPTTSLGNASEVSPNEEEEMDEDGEKDWDVDDDIFEENEEELSEEVEAFYDVEGDDDDDENYEDGDSVSIRGGSDGLEMRSEALQELMQDPNAVESGREVTLSDGTKVKMIPGGISFTPAPGTDQEFSWTEADVGNEDWEDEDWGDGDWGEGVYGREWMADMEGGVKNDENGRDKESDKESIGSSSDGDDWEDDDWGDGDWGDAESGDDWVEVKGKPKDIVEGGGASRR